MASNATVTANSLWTYLSPPVAVGGTLHGPHAADVVIVGGSAMGHAAALHLAMAGVSVTVVDGGGRGIPEPATNASGGLIAPQMIRGTPQSTLQQMGSEAGQRMLDLVARAGGYTRSLVETHGLDCAYQGDGFIAPFSSAQAAHSELVAREWAEFRDDVSIVDSAETERLTGCRGYAGALVDRSGGAINPAAYAQALGRRAAALGARLYRGEPAVAVERQPSGGVIVRMAGGATLKARRAILAANGGTMALHPALARSMVPMRVREVATAPVPQDVRAHVLPQGHAMTDRGPDIFTIRYDQDGRLVTAANIPWAHGLRATTRAVNKRLAHHIPGWRPLPLEFAWSGVAWLNATLSPRFVVPEADILAIQACNGRGIAMAGVLGEQAALWAMGQETLDIPLSDPLPIPGHALARHMPNIALNMAGLKGLLAR
ncbi:MAG: FAD-dependent oxidoreductase [Sphingobium sp.]